MMPVALYTAGIFFAGAGVPTILWRRAQRRLNYQCSDMAAMFALISTAQGEEALKDREEIKRLKHEISFLKSSVAA